MYKAATINVTDSAWVEITPDFDIETASIYSEAGSFEVGLKQQGVYGDSIKVYKGLPFNDDIGANKLRLKSLSGTIAISYYISDKRG